MTRRPASPHVDPALARVDVEMEGGRGEGGREGCQGEERIKLNINWNIACCIAAVSIVVL